jgi:hypothetical protein
MGAVVVKINHNGVRELLRSPEVLADLERRARAIAAAAGPGMVVDSEIGPNRARASVRTGTFAARHAEATRRALSRALDAGRA